MSNPETDGLRAEISRLRTEADELRLTIGKQEATIRTCNQKIGELELWGKDYRDQIAFWKAKAQGSSAAGQAVQDPR